MSRFRKDPDPRFWRLNRSLDKIAEKFGANAVLPADVARPKKK